MTIDHDAVLGWAAYMNSSASSGATMLVNVARAYLDLRDERQLLLEIVDATRAHNMDSNTSNAVRLASALTAYRERK